MEYEEYLLFFINFIPPTRDETNIKEKKYVFRVRKTEKNYIYFISCLIIEKKWRTISYG